MVQDNWLKILCTLAGSAVVIIFWRAVAYYKFKRRRTDNVITVSVNKIEILNDIAKDAEVPLPELKRQSSADKSSKRYCLRFFTLADGPLPEFISVSIAAQDLFCRAAKRTTVKKPLIDMSPLDSVVKDMLNNLSAIFAEGIIARDRGLPVHKFEYVVIFSCERFPRKDPHWNETWEKPRVLLVEKSVLLGTDFTDESGFNLEVPHHIWRVRTLHQAQRDFASGNPKSCFTMKIFLRK
jgi:hypothetical protein